MIGCQDGETRFVVVVSSFRSASSELSAVAVARAPSSQIVAPPVLSLPPLSRAHRRFSTHCCCPSDDRIPNLLVVEGSECLSMGPNSAPDTMTSPLWSSTMSHWRSIIGARETVESVRPSREVCCKGLHSTRQGRSRSLSNCSRPSRPLPL